LIEQGKAVRTPQDEQEATYAPMLKKEMAKLDFTKTAQQVHNWVRGMNPWPTAYCMFNGKMLKIHASAKSGKQLKTGLARVEDNRLFIGCAEGAIEVLTLQMEGARRMDTAQFLCGHAGKIDGYQF
jgi:methionyl-tRNA formyltransferase